MQNSKVVCSMILACSICSAPLAAQQAVAAKGAAKERIQYIEKSLIDGQKNARIWWGLWIAGYAGLAAGQYMFSAMAWNYNQHWSMGNELRRDFHLGNKKTFPRREQWLNYFVGGTKCVLSLGLLLVNPFTPAYAANRLTGMPEGTADEISKKLTLAESLFEKCAKKERMGRAWWKHLLGFCVNAGGSVIIWQLQRGNDPWKDALISFFTGMAVFEATIWTQPTRAIRDWDEYKKRYYGVQNAAYNDGYEDQWYLAPCPGGIAVGMSF